MFIFTILFELGKYLAGFAILLFFWVVIKHYTALSTVRYYQAQGMTAYPGF
jgi:hypothetical protein